MVTRWMVLDSTSVEYTNVEIKEKKRKEIRNSRLRLRQRQRQTDTEKECMCVWMRSKCEKMEKEIRTHSSMYCVSSSLHSAHRLWFCLFCLGKKRKRARREFKVVEMIYIIIFDDDGASFLWLLHSYKSYGFFSLSRSRFCFFSLFAFFHGFSTIRFFLFSELCAGSVLLVLCTFRPFASIQKASIMPHIIYYRVYPTAASTAAVITTTTIISTATNTSHGNE